MDVTSRPMRSARRSHVNAVQSRSHQDPPLPTRGHSLTGERTSGTMAAWQNDQSRPRARRTRHQRLPGRGIGRRKRSARTASAISAVNRSCDAGACPFHHPPLRNAVGRQPRRPEAARVDHRRTPHQPRHCASSSSGVNATPVMRSARARSVGACRPPSRPASGNVNPARSASSSDGVLPRTRWGW